MSTWTDAITDERKKKAKALYRQLKSIGWNDLSRNDRKVMQLLGWFCLEEDDAGDPKQYIDADLPRESDEDDE